MAIFDINGTVLDEETTTIFAGKTASFYGDSLTEVNGHYSKGYYTWIKEILFLSRINNYGVSGYTTADVYNKINNVNDTADVISVMCGVNDQTYSIPLGQFGDSVAGTTYGNLDRMCSLLKQKYPTKTIFFITPHFQTNYVHSGGITSYEISKAIKEVCEKHSIPVYDNYVWSGICSSNLSYFTTDRCHWNDKAHEMVGKNVAKWVLDGFRYLYQS